MADPAFDIHAGLFGEETGLDEEAAHEYERDLARLFEESPEGQALAAESVELGFAGTIVHYLLGYEGRLRPRDGRAHGLENAEDCL